MAGTRAGGLKSRDKCLARDPDHYSKIGKIGGKISRGGGFCTMSKEQHLAVSARGGRNSSSAGQRWTWSRQK